MQKLKAILATILLVLTMSGLGSPALAVNPDEIMQDPVLEARARVISKNLRCLVCQNQSIDDSDADLARDLRLLVRERLTAGDTNTEVVDYMIDRFGEFVLLKPRFATQTLLLWGMPVLLLLLGGFVLVKSMRTKSKLKANALTVDEKAALVKILGNTS